MEHVTQLLHRMENGDAQAGAEFFPLVYDELKRLAQRQLRGERKGHILQATSLIHEAYIKLVTKDSEKAYKSRATFFTYASLVMRHILVDTARRNLAAKREGICSRSELEIESLLCPKPEEVIAVHEALEVLRQRDSNAAELIQLHYFAGFSMAEISELLGVSLSTVKRWHIYAKAFLKSEIPL